MPLYVCRFIQNLAVPSSAVPYLEYRIIFSQVFLFVSYADHTHRLFRTHGTLKRVFPMKILIRIFAVDRNTSSYIEIRRVMWHRLIGRCV